MPKHPFPMSADLVKDQRLGNICTGAFGRRLLSAYATFWQVTKLRFRLRFRFHTEKSYGSYGSCSGVPVPQHCSEVSAEGFHSPRSPSSEVSVSSCSHQLTANHPTDSSSLPTPHQTGQSHPECQSFLGVFMQIRTHCAQSCGALFSKEQLDELERSR
jgi:hypothetical protein